MHQRNMKPSPTVESKEVNRMSLSDTHWLCKLRPEVARVLDTIPRVPRILLADDDPDLRHLVASALRKDDYDVVELRDGDELLAQLEPLLPLTWFEQQLDLIVADVRMPGSSGLEILEGLRQARLQTPVILITAYDDQMIQEKARSLGAFVFSKPFNMDDLRTAVLYCLKVSPSSRRSPACPSL